MAGSIIIIPAGVSTSLTDAEQERVGTLLANVSTRTLLHSLARLCHDNDDIALIISALLDRLPPDDHRTPE